MSLLLPSAPAGTHGPTGAGDGHHARREMPDGDFAAALAETAGDNSDEAKGHDARSENADDAARLLRAVRRLAARGAREPHNGEAAMPRAGANQEVAAEPRTKGVRRSEDKAPTKAEAPDLAEDLAAANRPEPVVSGDAAREVLAALGVDMAARPERMVAGSEFGASLRLVAGMRGIDMDAHRAGGAREPDLGDESEAEILTVRVVQQERHFKPAGVEMQRWQGAQSAAEGAQGTAMPAADPKLVQPEAAVRDRTAVAAAQARAAEPAAQVAQPMSATGEVMPGTVGVQIADRVQEALGKPSETAASSPPAGAVHDSESRQVFAPAIRILKLQLNPASLGTVTIVLSGNDDGLRIELAAELADTVTKVDNDRGALAARLNGAGYSVTEISVARLGGQGTDSDARDQGARQGSAQEQFAGNASREGGGQFGGQHAGLGGHQSSADGPAGGSGSAAAAPVVAGVSYAGRFRPV